MNNTARVIYGHSEFFCCGLCKNAVSTASHNIVTDKFGRIWKEQVVAYSKCHSHICMKEVREERQVMAVRIYIRARNLPKTGWERYCFCVRYNRLLGVLANLRKSDYYLRHSLMFFWPCIMIWLYINYQLDAQIIIYWYNIIFLYIFRAGTTRVRLPMVSLEFFIDIILPVTLWPWGRLSL